MSTHDDLVLAVAMLRKGGVVAFPTETVYGLGADALNADAVRRVFEIKGRPAHHPLIVHLAAAEQLREWARDVPDAALDLAQRFWPGPLTLILRRGARVPDVVTGGQDTVALRVPNHALVLELLRQFGGGLVGPSANRFGRVSPTQAAHVRAELGEKVDLILEGGSCAVGVESTILDLSGARPRILRPGAVTPAMLSEALGVAVGVATGVDNAGSAAPGTLPAHYAPRTPLRVVPTHKLHQEISALLAFGRRVAVLELGRAASQVPRLERGVHPYLMPDAAAEYARALYATLRQADEAGYDQLLIEAPPDTEEWLAVNDRLRRAAEAYRLGYPEIR